LRNKNIAVTAFALKSQTEGVRGDDSFGAEFVYRTTSLTAGGIPPDRPEFRRRPGFVPAARSATPIFSSRSDRAEALGILQMFFGADGDFITDLDNRLETRRLNFTPLSLSFRTGDSFAVRISPQYEYLKSPSGSTLCTRYHPGTMNLRAEPPVSERSAAQLLVSSTFGWGGFWSGSRRDTLLGMGYKVAVLSSWPRVREEPDRAARRRIHHQYLPPQRNVLFRPNITLYSYLQYDNSPDHGWQSRFRWILTPGNEVLVVWNSRWADPLERLELAEGSARIKLRYNHRF